MKVWQNLLTRKTDRPKANSSGRGRKIRVGDIPSNSNPEIGNHADKHNESYVLCTIDVPRLIRLIHGPHSSYKCKLTSKFENKYTSGRPSNKKYRKQEVNYMMHNAVD